MNSRNPYEEDPARIRIRRKTMMWKHRTPQSHNSKWEVKTGEGLCWLDLEDKKGSKIKQMAAPLPLILRNPPLRLCTHHLLPPLSHTTTTATTTAEPFSLISFSSYNARSFPILKSTQMEGGEITEEVTETTETNVIGKKKVFVAGATGNTGKRIVEQLLAKGFSVKAGVRNLEKAKASLPSDNAALQIVKADVTDGSAKLAEAISDDSDAVICATGFSYGWDVFAPWKVDNFGTVNLVEACRKLGVNRFILVSSILVNGAAMGQILNPAYIFLNVFGLTLIAKLQAENYIRRSGINYTIIRPGGLKNDPPTGNLVMESEDTLSEGSISRDLVAEVAVEALANPEASYKVVEIVSRPDAPKRTYEDLFGSIKQR